LTSFNIAVRDIKISAKFVIFVFSTYTSVYMNMLYNYIIQGVYYLENLEFSLGKNLFFILIKFRDF